MPLFPCQEWACQWDCNIRNLFINVPSSLFKAPRVTANASLCNSFLTSLAYQIPMPLVWVLLPLNLLMKLLKRPAGRGELFGLCFDSLRVDFSLRTQPDFSVLDAVLSVAAKQEVETLTSFYHYQKQGSSALPGRQGEKMGVLGRSFRIPLLHHHSGAAL